MVACIDSIQVTLTQTSVVENGTTPPNGQWLDIQQTTDRRLPMEAVGIQDYDSETRAGLLGTAPSLEATSTNICQLATNRIG